MLSIDLLANLLLYSPYRITLREERAMIIELPHYPEPLLLRRLICQALLNHKTCMSHISDGSFGLAQNSMAFLEVERLFSFGC